MIKRYIANCTEFNIFLTLEDDRVINLDFSGKDVVTRKRFIDVSDEMIQKALDKSKSNGIYFNPSPEFNWLKEGDKTDNLTIVPGRVEDVSPVKEKIIEPIVNPKNIDDLPKMVIPPKETETPVVDLPKDPEEMTFRIINDAKEYLHENHKMPYNKLPNKDAIIKEFKGLGIEVKFENNKN